MSNIIGIDVSKASLDCAYLRDPDQDKAKRKSCPNEVRCFASLVAWAEAKEIARILHQLIITKSILASQRGSTKDCR